MRVVISPQFEDLVGQRNLTSLENFALMTTAATTDGGGTPVETGDELLEEFLVATFEDIEAALDSPRADWEDGAMQAAFAFDGTGGPGGEFDFHVPPNTDFVFDTTSTLLFGGPDGLPQYSQLAVNGRLDVRNLVVPESSSIRIQGPNPALILASGYVQVAGKLQANGGSAAPVFTLNTPNQPESGGSGQAGGGDGGTGSYLVTQVTQRGGQGEGAFGAPNLGGEGGESGWSNNNGSNGVSRRCGGGGGGVLGPNQIIVVTTDPLLECYDQAIYGLDAEAGFPGQDSATSSQGQHIPYGGHRGPTPFDTLNGTADDFFGTKIADFNGTPTVVQGELQGPLAGAGGGAGGDATYVPTGTDYPPPTLIYNHQDKGAGGGGGAGSLTIMALGDIIVTNTGRITAIGGHGAGGENTSGVNRIGGGSGGGSGGHIILQTASRIDLSAATNPAIKALDARGGQGGAGAADQGGAKATGEIPNVPSDGKHIGPANGVDNPWEEIDPACKQWTDDFYSGTHKWVVRCAGGDGGPGLIQIHVGDLATDVLYPAGNEAALATITQPVPHGYSLQNTQWEDHLLPVFGRFSKAQSKWIPLGGATVDPLSSTPDSLGFLFDGTDTTTGMVNTTGGVVDALPALLAPGGTFEAAGLPELKTGTTNTARLDASTLGAGDLVYKRNPQLLRNFALEVGSGSFVVASATYVEGEDVLEVTVATTPGSSLADATGAVELLPRYFGISTLGSADSLPTSASIMIEFQAAEALTGDQSAPNETTLPAWTTDIADLNSLSGTPFDNTDIRFVRFRVTFDITQGTAPLDFSTPLPKIDFLRMPFKF